MGFDIARLVDGRAFYFQTPIKAACRHYNIEPVRDMHTGGYYDYQCQECGNYFDEIEAKALFDPMNKEFDSFMELARARELVKAND